jgi:hypothetical protein
MHDRFRPLYADPYNPTMRSSESLEVSVEQQNLIRQVLDYSSSDTLFAKKAYDAIFKILTEGSVLVPVVESLSPESVTIGSPAFDIHVVGTDFDENATIFFNGIEEPTTRVSETELTTGVNMPLWEAPVDVPVTVQNGSGVLSNTVLFSFLPVARTENQTERLKQVKESNDLNRELHKNTVGSFDNLLKDRSFVSPPAKNDPYLRDPKRRRTEADVRRDQVKTETHNRQPLSGNEVPNTPPFTKTVPPHHDMTPPTNRAEALKDSIKESHRTEESKTEELLKETDKR